MVDTLGEKIERVKKRDGGIVPFDSNKIARAIFRAMDNTKNVEKISFFTRVKAWFSSLFDEDKALAK